MARQSTVARKSGLSHDTSAARRRGKAVAGFERLENRMLMSAVRPDAAFMATDLGVGDDRSFPTTGTTGVSLGFATPVDFFGSRYSGVFVNNNGHVSFGARNSFYFDYGLESLGSKMIAPFYANVDTRFTPGNTARYGRGMVDGHNAFGVTWTNVGYYPNTASQSPRNSFQLILIDRSDLGSGSFDIEFNYDHIGWESGISAGGGSDGLGGSGARIGWTFGTNEVGTIFQMAGSGVAGSFLDSNVMTGLIHNSFGSDVDGRYVYRFRGGTWADEPASDNTAPVLNLPGDQLLAESADGMTHLLLGAAFIDPDADFWNVTIDYGDGSGPMATAWDASGAFDINHVYMNEGNYVVTVTVDDGQGGVATGSLNVFVQDVTAPVVTGVSMAESVSENQTSELSLVLGSDPDDYLYTYDWEGSGTADGSRFLFHATDNGQYMVRVTVTDPSGNATVVEVPATVTNVAPTAAGFSGATMLDEGGTVTFGLIAGNDASPDDLLAGLIYSFDLDGDGVFELVNSDGVASHTFTDNGTYVVRARVSDKDGGHSEYTKEVTVMNVAPVATLGGASAGNEGQVLGFSLGSAADPSSADVAAGLVFGFDFNNDGVYEVSGSSPTAAHVFDDNGTYVVRARVTDKDGASSDYSMSVVVNNVAPGLGSFTDNNPVAEGSLVALTFGGMTDPSGADTAAGFTYSYDFNNDGTFDLVSRSASATHRYGDNGTYTVRGRVTDKDGGYTEYLTDVEVYNVAPTATLGTMGGAVEGSLVTIGLNGATDASAADVAAGLTYSFDLDNDGVYEVSGPGSTVTKHVANDGSFVIRGRVTDKDGGHSDYTATINVANAAPVVSSFTSSASTFGSAEAGDRVSVSGSFTDAGVLDHHTAVVDWGDGTTSSVSVYDGSGSGTFFASHVYQQGGMYNVTLKLSDDAAPAGVATASAPAIVSGVSLRDGVLHVIGTNGNDRVSLVADRNAIKVKTGLTKRDLSFISLTVREIRVSLGGGRDTFDADPAIMQPIYLNGVRYGTGGATRRAYSATKSLFSDRLVA